jgi:hypothetical protein
MLQNNKIQTKIGKWLSVYTLLLFICLPVFEVVSNFGDVFQIDFIEIQENLEIEIEDISDNKELSEKDHKILQTLNTYNAKSVKASIYISEPLFSNFNSEVKVPPPEC